MSHSRSKSLLKSLLFASSFFVFQNLEAKSPPPKGILYRMDTKGNVVATPLSQKLLSENNIDGKTITNDQIKLLAEFDKKKVLPAGTALKAVARAAKSKDEFNDADAAAKPALYFSFGFGRPYWGGYASYYRPTYYYSDPYYYGGYYAPRVVYYDSYWYNPVYYRPYYASGYYYSYYSCGC
jgi:hypothetical protein